VDRLVMKNLSESSCGDYLFICIKGLCNNIYHLTVVYSDLGAPHVPAGQELLTGDPD